MRKFIHREMQPHTLNLELFRDFLLLTSIFRLSVSGSEDTAQYPPSSGSDFQKQGSKIELGPFSTNLDAPAAGAHHAARDPSCICTAQQPDSISNVVRLSEAWYALRREELVLELFDSVRAAVDDCIRLCEPDGHGIGCGACHECILRNSHQSSLLDAKGIFWLTLSSLPPKAWAQVRHSDSPADLPAAYMSCIPQGCRERMDEM